MASFVAGPMAAILRCCRCLLVRCIFLSRSQKASTPFTLVKMSQGIERHIAGGTAADWLGYLLLFASFALGAAVGGGISLVVNGLWMLVVASVVCALTTGYTYFHQDRRALQE